MREKSGRNENAGRRISLHCPNRVEKKLKTATFLKERGESIYIHTYSDMMRVELYKLYRSKETISSYFPHFA